MFFSIKEGFSDLKRTPFSTFFTVFVIFLSLFIINIFFFIKHNIDTSIDKLKSQNLIEVFVKAETSQSKIEKLKVDIENLIYVKKVIFISKNEALEIFKKEFHDNPIAVIGYNPLPVSLKITLKKQYVQTKYLNKMIEFLNASSIGEDISRQSGLKKLNKMANIINKAGVAVVLLISCLALLLIFNSIRITIKYKQNIIRTMSLVGASNGSIRNPFIVGGIVEGLLGGIFAYYGIKIINVITNVFLQNDYFQEITLPGFDILIKIILFGGLLGLVGSILAINRYLTKY